jgi:hypothetical protein
MTKQSFTAESALARERERWVGAVRARVAMWRQTSDDVRIPGELREEARARANEAQFIADLIETGSPDF